MFKGSILGWIIEKIKGSGRSEPDFSMSSKPKQAPAVFARPRDDGGLEVRIELEASGMGRLVGGSGFERTFQLDPLGREVYEACDGRRTVKGIVRKFASSNKLSQAEAELSVTTFLQMLSSKGLIFMVQ